MDGWGRGLMIPSCFSVVARLSSVICKKFRQLKPETAMTDRFSCHLTSNFTLVAGLDPLPI